MPTYPLKVKRVAVVTVKIRVNERTAVEMGRQMSTDLPATDLGELLALAMNEYAGNGGDPVDCHAVVYFR